MFFSTLVFFSFLRFLLLWFLRQGVFGNLPVVELGNSWQDLSISCVN